MNWIEEAAWTVGTAPSTIVGVAATKYRKKRSPNEKEVAAMLLAGAGYNYAMYKWLGASYLEAKQYLVLRTLFNERIFLETGRMAVRSWVPLTAYAGGVYLMVKHIGQPGTKALVQRPDTNFSPMIKNISLGTVV